MEIISSKKLKSISAPLTVIIDGIGLYHHAEEDRMLTKADAPEDQINIETLYHTLILLQNTALNLSGNQRVLIRTTDLKVIQVDPRLSVPMRFKDFQRMMHKICEDGAVKSEDRGTVLMKFIKSDISQFVPSGSKRVSLYCGEGPITSIHDAVPDSAVVYIHSNTSNTSADELMEGRFVVSNDPVPANLLAYQVVREVENRINIY